MTMIMTENYRLIHAVFSVCIYNIYEIWMKAKSFPTAFCQFPSTEAVNIICQLNSLLPVQELSPVIPVFCSKQSLFRNHELDQILFIPLQFMGIQFNTRWNGKTSIFPESLEILSWWNIVIPFQWDTSSRQNRLTALKCCSKLSKYTVW